jgi:hypothetical protein
MEIFLEKEEVRIARIECEINYVNDEPQTTRARVLVQVLIISSLEGRFTPNNKPVLKYHNHPKESSSFFL